MLAHFCVARNIISFHALFAVSNIHRNGYCVIFADCLHTGIRCNWIWYFTFDIPICVNVTHIKWLQNDNKLTKHSNKRLVSSVLCALMALKDPEHISIVSYCMSGSNLWPQRTLSLRFEQIHFILISHWVMSVCCIFLRLFVCYNDRGFSPEKQWLRILLLFFLFVRCAHFSCVCRRISNISTNYCFSFWR